MEYLNLVNRIIAAERNAKEIVRETKDSEPTMEAELREEIDAIRGVAMGRAREKVAEAERQINARAEADLVAWDKKLEESMTRVESAYNKYRDNWVNTLFEMIAKGLE